MNNIDIAWMLAEKYHAGQMYGGHNYLYHLRAVHIAVQLRFGGTDERLEQLAILHDIREDTDIPVFILEEFFDSDVCEAIRAISKWEGQTREHYLAAVKANPLALKVKLCDAWCNLQESWLRKDSKRITKYTKLITELEVA